MKVNTKYRAGRQRLLMDLLLLFYVTVIKIEGKYDIVIRDDELEGTVEYRTGLASEFSFL